MRAKNLPNLVFGPPPSDLKLTLNEIHIWSTCVDQPQPEVHGLEKLLSREEKIRAEKFHFERHRMRFIVGRGFLRTILGRYLCVKPGRLQLIHGKNGKPTLAGAYADTGVSFNLSHSKGQALYAITLGREIVVDIEYIHDFSDMEQIADNILSASEKIAFRKLQKQKKLKVFFKCWTRKKAFLKALGTGLSQSMDMIDITTFYGEETAGEKIEVSSDEISKWSIHDIAPIPGFAAAFAVKGDRKSVV